MLAASLGASGIGLVGVALAFGLTVVTMAYAVGHISGGHFNPAVTLGVWAGGRFAAGKIVVYIVTEVLGAIAASAVLYVIASGMAGYTLAAAIAVELVMTFFFLLVISGVTDRRAPAGLAPLAIGLALTQLWVFIVFPIVGGVVDGLVHRYWLEAPPAARAVRARPCLTHSVW